MNEIVSINGRAIERMIYRELPVVTLGMVDDLHERPAGTAGRNFRENKARFIEQEDYFAVPKEEWATLVRRNSSHQDDLSGRNSSAQERKNHGGHRGDMIFLTETGYMMLVKSFTDDISWQIQRQLVKCYFAMKSLSIQNTPQNPVQTKVTVNTSDLVREANKGNRFAQRLLHHLTGMQVDDIAADIEHKLVVEDFRRAELAANYLDLLFVAEKHHGIERGENADGASYLQGKTEQFFNVFRQLGKEHGLPMIAKSEVGLGQILAKEATGLEFYGWRRNLEKRSSGSRYFRFTKIRAV